MASSAMADHVAELYRSIYEVVRRIPRGHVATYGQVAELAGLPGGARVAGAAMKTCKPGDALPWQRVIGKASANRGRIAIHNPVGAAIQRQLLDAEGVHIGDTGLIALDRYGWLPGTAPRGRKPSRRAPPAALRALSQASRAASPSARASSPPTRAASPASRAASPSARAASPASRAASPASRASSPSSRASSPSARTSSPSARPSSPSARAASPSARASSPSTRTSSPSARASSPSARTSSPSARAAAPSARAAAPSALRSQIARSPARKRR